MTKVYKLTEADITATERISHLLNSLRSAPVPLDIDQLNTLLSDDSFNLFVAENHKGAIIGILTLTRCRTLAGDKVWIEDVIVDENCRRTGAGRALVKAAVDHASIAFKGSTIWLTSNPSRMEARNLYRSEGFEEYETGVFRISPTKQG